MSDEVEVTGTPGEDALATIATEEITEPTPQDMLAIDAALMRGSYGALTVSQRLALVKRKCDLLGVHIEFGPFVWGSMNGKLALIPTKNLSQQLRANKQISVDVIERVLDVERGIYSVRVRTTGPDHRHDEDIGIVSILNLKGEALGNAMMTAETKAKNRATLSHCGVGGTDETEIPQVSGGSLTAPRLEDGRQVVDPNRGRLRVIDPEPSQSSAAVLDRAVPIDPADEVAALVQEEPPVTVVHATRPASPPVVPPRPRPSGAPRATKSAPHLGRPPANSSSSKPPAPRPPTKAPVRARR